MKLPEVSKMRPNETSKTGFMNFMTKSSYSLKNLDDKTRITSVDSHRGKNISLDNSKR
jgi:hypothetical protein